MTEVNFAMLGRKLMRDNPDAAHSYQSEINQFKAESLSDTSHINQLFILFCHYQNIEIETLRYNGSRNSQKNIDNRRLFIAAVMQMFDPLSIHGYTGRKMDKVRQKLSDVLNCNKIWISQVWPSIQNDIERLRGYKQETEIVINYLKSNLATDSDTPVFLNTKKHQLQLFE